MTEEDDIWQFRTLAGGATLMARADDEMVVALIEREESAFAELASDWLWG